MSQPIRRLADACQKILVEIERRTQHRHAPVLVAVDCGSGAGKSTLAAMLGREIEAVVVPLRAALSAVRAGQWHPLLSQAGQSCHDVSKRYSYPR